MSGSDHEEIPGLPGALPPGEELLWQGRPEWKPLARHVYRIHWIALYFGLMVFARAVLALTHTPDIDDALEILGMIALFSACLGIVALVAWGESRSAIYSITTHRVVMRIGAALSVTWNLPFRRILSADLAMRDEHDGDIVLQLDDEAPVRWLVFWPHVQPGHVLRARPALRFLREPARASEILGNAVARWGVEQRAPVRVTSERPTRDHAPPHELALEAGR